MRRRWLAGVAALVVVLLFIVSVYYVGRSRSAQELRSEPAPSRGTLRYEVMKAKEREEQKLILIAPVVDYGYILGDTDLILATFNVLIAEPVQRRAGFTDSTRTVWTFNKFRILENVSGGVKPCGDCPSESFPPPIDLLPLKQDEFLLPQLGGTVVVDGITVVMKSFETQFVGGESYLLFLLFGSDRVAGAVGVYKLDRAGTIAKRVPCPGENRKLMRDMERRFHGSVAALKSYMRSKGFIRL